MSTRELIKNYYGNLYNPNPDLQKFILPGGFQIEKEYSNNPLHGDYRCPYAVDLGNPSIQVIQAGPITNRSLNRANAEVLTPSTPADIVGLTTHALTVSLWDKTGIRMHIPDMNVPIIEVKTLFEDGTKLMNMDWEDDELWRIEQFGHRLPNSGKKGRIIPNFDVPSVQFNTDKVGLEAQCHFDEKGFPLADGTLQYNSFAPIVGSAAGYKLAIKETGLFAYLLIKALPANATTALSKS